ncbi:MAG: WYL domain-containing protein [bacterium]
MSNDRYSKITDLLELITHIHFNGAVSIEDIMKQANVSRRTAERIRTLLKNTYYDFDVISIDGKVKKWGFTGPLSKSAVRFSADEIAELENIKQGFEEQGIHDKSQSLDKILSKLKVHNSTHSTSLENDVEALIEAEGFAIRPHPRSKVNTEHFQKIRYAIKASKMLKIEYKKDKSKKSDINKIHPYGILYGEKQYLVAYNADKQQLRSYKLLNIQNIEVLKEYFEIKDSFSFQDYAKRSFGVFHEEPYDVKLLFTKDVANDVMNYCFHHTQVLTPQENGTVLVEFKAGGSLEICWYLFKWGNKVKILAPDKIINTYKKLLSEAAEAIEELSQRNKI